MAVRALARSRRWVLGSVAAGVAVAVFIGVTQFSANAATTSARASLALPGAADVVATDDHVFVSGGAQSDEVVVTNATGTVVGGLTGLPGPTDLLLSSDRRTLYIALPNVNAIEAYDAESLRALVRYSTGGGTCPRSLAQSGQWLWFGYACDNWNWGGNIGRIDLAATPATVATALVTTPLYGAPLLDAPAGGAATLVVGQRGLSPGSLLLFGITSDGALTLLRTSAFGTVGGNLRDIAVSGDGSAVFTASGAPYAVVGYGTADLTQQMSLPTTPYPNAVELSPDGTLIAGGSDALYDKDVFVFRRNGTRVGTVEFGSEETLIDRGLAWSPDGTKLYAVSVHPYEDVPPTLHVLLVSA